MRYSFYKILTLSIFLSSIAMANDIKVEVTNLLNTNGELSIGLYNKNDDTFGDRKNSLKGIDLKIDGKRMFYTFKNIPNGTYAIAVLHDENKNKKLDTNFLGIPSEGYGFSNNLRPMLRGVNFEEAKFNVNGDVHITINMGY